MESGFKERVASTLALLMMLVNCAAIDFRRSTCEDRRLMFLFALSVVKWFGRAQISDLNKQTESDLHEPMKMRVLI